MRLRLAVLVVVAAVAAPALGAVPSEPERRVVGLVDVSGFAEGDDHLGATVVAVAPVGRFIVVETDAPAVFEARARLDPSVRYVETPGKVSVSGDPLAGSQYAPAQISLPSAAVPPGRLSGVTVCVIDTGADVDHEDFAPGAIAGARSLLAAPPNGADRSVVTDGNGHGTHVAGIVAAAAGNAVGVAGVANVSLHVAQALTADGNGADDAAALAVDWCARLPPVGGVPQRVVITMSFGGRVPRPHLSDSISGAWDAGHLLVAAAGNEGCTPCVVAPASHPDVIAVACTMRLERRCPFSSAGPEVELAAPGASILGLHAGGAHDRYQYLSGTSMSAPHVAAAAALAWAKHPHLTNEEVRKLLHVTAQRLPGMAADGSTDPRFGHGEVDVACLLAEAGSCAHDPAPPACALPAAFGYRCLLAAEPSPPPATTAASGFVFDFYGAKYRIHPPTAGAPSVAGDVVASDRGFLTFRPLACSPCAPQLGEPVPPDAVVAVAWSSASLGAPLVEVVGEEPARQLVVTWTSGGATATIRLVEGTNDVVLERTGPAAAFPDALAGIEDPRGGDAVHVRGEDLAGRSATLVHPGAVVPAAPEGLRARTRATDPLLVDLAWSPPSEGSVVYYEVERSADGKTRSLGVTAKPAFLDDLRASCGGCRAGGAGASFEYSVRAVNAAGAGPKTTTCILVTPLAANDQTPAELRCRSGVPT